MSLRNEEIIRLKLELGFNVTNLGAEPYITYAAVFDKAVQPYLVDVGTTSSTPVVAAVSGAVVSLTIATNPLSLSPTQALSFVVGSNIVVDVGPFLETSTILTVTALVIGVQLTLAHAAPYPVLLQGSEQIVRDLFARLDAIKSEMINVAPKTAGMQQVDEIQFFGNVRGRGKTQDKFASLMWQRDEARRDLAGALGIPYLRDVRRGAGGGLAVY